MSDAKAIEDALKSLCPQEPAEFHHCLKTMQPGQRIPAQWVTYALRQQRAAYGACAHPRAVGHFRAV